MDETTTEVEEAETTNNESAIVNDVSDVNDVSALEVSKDQGYTELPKGLIGESKPAKNDGSAV